MPGCFVRSLHFSTLHDAMLTMLIYATCCLLMHLYTLAYMFMNESCLLVCCPYFNTMKSWTFDPNLHLSPVDTNFCLPFCLSTFLLAFLFLCLPCLSYLSALCLFHMPYTSLSFHCLSASFLFLPLHVHTWSEDLLS